MGKPYKTIGICGVARSGKDSLCVELISELAERGIKGQRIALADKLKADLEPFLVKSFGISPFTKDDGEKALIRDILVSYGKVRRVQSLGTFWTSICQPEIDKCISLGIVPIVTDIRYDFYEEDEANWIKVKNSGILIHIDRYENGELLAPPNKDELENDPKLKAKANVRLSMKTSPAYGGELREHARKILEDFKIA